MKTVDFYFDFMSPFAYLACTQYARLVKEYAGVAHIEPHAFNMWEARLAAGNTGPSNRTIPAKLKTLMMDANRWAKLYGVPLVAAKGYDVQPVNRGFLLAKDAGNAAAYIDAATKCFWGGDLDPASAEGIAGLAGACKLSPAEFLKAVDSDEIISRYETENKQAQARGVFGAPTFLVDDEIFWGNDRVSWLEKYLRETA